MARMLLFCALTVTAVTAESEGPWTLHVSVEQDSLTTPFYPFTTDIDFAATLREAGAEGRFAPGSVRVVRLEANGTEVPVPHALSEDFAWHDKGAVSWVIEQPDQLEYRVLFDIVEHGPFPPPQYTPPIGNGDNFRYNRIDGEDPVHCHGILPVSADFDGDGVVDLVSRAIYSSTLGQPWFTIWFWRNVGTNERPRYADFVRLYADGEVIPNHYSGCDLYDWDGDGLLDLVTSKTVYRNTGKISRSGAPVLTKLADMPEPGAGGVTYRFFIGMHDHDLDGVSDAYFQLSKVHYDYEGPPPRNFVEGAFFRLVNTAGPGEPPLFGSTEPVERSGAVWTEQYIPSDFRDMDGDGDLDLLGNSRPLDRIPSRPQYCYWPNIAPKGQAPAYGKAVLIPNAYNTGPYNVLSKDNAAYHGLFATEGHRIRYYEFTGESAPGQIPGCTVRGVLKQLNGRCGVDGYSSVDVEDWEGDGDWDIVAGDEMGSIWLIKNIGDNKRPVFETPWNIEANGEPIRIMRWHYIQDGNPEYYLGQSKPCYADWDSDGDRDIVAANNTDRLVLFENIGTRQEPRFTRSEVIRVGEDDAPFAKRRRPSVLDWNGDGATDVVTMSKDEQLCVFFGALERGENNLQTGQPLLNDTGQPLSAKHAEVCDWDGDGDWDLIAQEGKWGKAGPGLYKNAGTNAEPRYAPPVQVKYWGQGITLSAHEHSFSAVDWHGTGQLDLVCGGESGLFFFFRRPALDAPAKPTVTVGLTE